MTVIPENFCYTHIYEYLVKRTITILTKSKESDSEEADLEFELPIAEKPLRKGYNFYGSGHVKEIMLCPVTNITHVKASVMASMKDKIYVVSVTLEKRFIPYICCNMSMCGWCWRQMQPCSWSSVCTPGLQRKYAK